MFFRYTPTTILGFVSLETPRGLAVSWTASTCQVFSRFFAGLAATGRVLLRGNRGECPSHGIARAASDNELKVYSAFPKELFAINKPFS
jgi:hypothetical protein